MDTQLKELIDTIKSEGVQSAEKQAQQIVAAAEEKAQEIINASRKQASQIVDEAKADRTRQEAAGKEAVKQAARDLVLSVQAEFAAIFKEVIEGASGEAYSGDVLARAIETVVSGWATGAGEKVDVLLSESDAKALESTLRNRLADKLKEGTEIRPVAAVKGGFRIASRDGSIYYDFTTEAIADAVAAFVTPRLAETIRAAAQGA